MSRIAVVLPTYPIRNYKIDAHGYDQHDKIFVVRVLCQYIQSLVASVEQPFPTLSDEKTHVDSCEGDKGTKQDCVARDDEVNS